MFGLFKQKHIDEDFFEWSAALSNWIIENFDGLGQIKKTPLILPTAQFFPQTDLKDHAYAEYITQQITKHADMNDHKEWPYHLVAQSKRAPGFVDGIAMKTIESLPLGTFATQNDAVAEITYDPELIHNPQALIATLSHEFAHFLMQTAKTPPPGGWEEEEPCTDGLAIFMGFGIFIANTSSYFSSNSEGWEYGHSGYLCEGEILHVLSSFLLISGHPIEDACTHLKPHLAKRLTKIYQQAKEREPFI